MLHRSFVFLAFVKSLGTLSGVHRASTGSKHTVRGAICTRGAGTLVVEEVQRSAATGGINGSFFILMY